MDDKKQEVFQLRLSESQRRKLRFIANVKDAFESQVVRELIEDGTERTMHETAIRASIPGAILQFDLPPSAEALPYADILAMLDEERAHKVAEFVTERAAALVKEYRTSLGYTADVK